MADDYLRQLAGRLASGVSSGRLRVLAITPDYPPAVGGIQLLFHRVLRHADRLDTRVVTISPPHVAEARVDSDGDVVRTPPLPDHRLEVVLMNGLAIREAHRFRPDLVFCAHIVAAPAAAAISKALGVPTVLYVYGNEIGASPAIARFAMRRSSAIIAISRYTRSLALGAGADEARLHVIPPGVDWAPHADKPRHERPTVITVARLEERYKGHDMMIRALPLIRARVPDVQWLVIGDGPLRDQIIDLAEANGVTESVTFLGSVADGDRNAWLDRAHVFAMPSRLPAGRAAGEGFGIVYLEAGVHGLPVVAGNVGGATDAVVDGITGRLVDPTSSVAVADAISDMLLDQSLAEQLGHAGAARARDFSWPAISLQVEELLFSVASL